MYQYHQLRSRGVLIRQLRFLFGLILLVLVGCTSEKPAETELTKQSETTTVSSPIRFAEITEKAGVEFQYHNDEESDSFAILESLGGGVAVWDYDLNGLPDLFFPGGGTIFPDKQPTGLPSVFFSQVAPGTYQNRTASAGISASPHYSHGCSVADFDNDGFPDLVVTGYGGILCWHNLGDGTFEEISQEAGLIDPSWSSSAGWGDLNGDGALDLYLAHYVDWSIENNPACGAETGARDVCPPRRFTGLDDRVFYSNGDGTFRDATQEAGLVPKGKGLGVVLGDVDNDRDTDVYVANDTTNNFLYLNDGEGQLKESALSRGVAVDDQAVANGSMGIDLGDYNGDGMPDLWVANYESEAFALYKNLGAGQFLYASRESGVISIGNLFVGFGTKYGDFDSDGDEDIVVANGHVVHFPRHATVRQLPLLLENDQGQFRRLSFAKDEYLGQPHYGRGVATGDLDHDGDLDLVFANCNERAAILENQTESVGDWIQLHLIGTESNRNAIGATVVLHTSAGDQFRYVTGGGSYLSQSAYEVHAGIPEGAALKGVTVYWPSGKVSEEQGINTKNQMYNLIE
ncbi:FG-GAP repeat protein [Gimesia panareensis]|uniref:FG-GAP repeat protein n=1 Tax=Gimesia panareensis TaxID=2527978 RepID=A0A518FTQ7_9PLAN|nr:FG-GAP repeat protein [Gimesia panareensis]